MRFQSYFNTAVTLLQQYDGSMPLLHFLKQYFALNKKHGSKDRKLITHLCYNYFRIGHVLKDISVEERLRVALFLCNENTADWYILFDQNWLDNWNNDLYIRIDFIQSVYPSFSINAIFPWMDELSEGVDKRNFILSHLIQPDLFLRIRPGKEKWVLQKLNDQQIQFRQMGPSCLALPNASKIDTVLTIDDEAVVQDYSSQRIGEFLQPAIDNSRLTKALWDCCAASGGKSILAYDTIDNIQLTVSDLRPAILRNLKDRFEKAGIKNYQSVVADLTNSKFNIQNSKFNLILCDAPCSGSGTWSRTPEQLYFFAEEKIAEYAALQKKIVTNVLKNVTGNGYFLYITCSVFQKENEEIVSFIQQNAAFEVVKMELLKGYDEKADSMFAALLRRVG